METPLLRVSRPVSACARCRNAKIRCDGKLPACSACERAGKAGECSSANDLFAKGKERSYVSSLELRIEKLERQIAQTRAEQAGASILYPSTPYTPQSNGVRPPKQTTETSDVDDLVSDFGYLVLNATSTGYNGFDKEMSFTRLAISSATIESLPKGHTASLPMREETMSLVQYCIKHVFSVYPVLTETSIFGSVEAVYQHNGRFARPRQIWDVRMILAIGLLCQSSSKVDIHHQAATGHAAVALEQAEAVLQPGVTITSQAVLLLTLYSMLNPSHLSPWYLLSIAIRVWLDIGLHQESAHADRPPHIIQSHRRLFYCMYSLDRLIAFSHVRLLGFIDDTIDVRLPAIDNSPRFQNSQLNQGVPKPNEDSFILLARFRQIESSLYHSLFSSSHQRLHEPWTSRMSDVIALRHAHNELANGASETQSTILSLDLNYMIALLLQPVETQYIPDRYGNYLLFDATISYAGALAWLIRQTEPAISCTSLELMRAKRVIRCFMAVLDTYSNDILAGIGPQPPEAAIRQQLPIRSRSPFDASSAIRSFISSMRHALDVLGLRFGLAKDHKDLIEGLSSRLFALSTQQHRERHEAAIRQSHVHSIPTTYGHNR